MDLFAIIQDLHEERKKLDQIISSLEELRKPPTSSDPALETRRGRRSMDAQARMEVSRRMKKYWASRRNGNGDTA